MKFLWALRPESQFSTEKLEVVFLNRLAARPSVSGGPCDAVPKNAQNSH